MVKNLKFFKQSGGWVKDILSPQLFNIYGEHIIREILEHWTGDISIGGRRISNLQHALDNEKMAELINLAKIVSKKLAFRINASKINVMVVDWAKCLPVSTTLSKYEKLKGFVYLGSIIKADGGSLAKIWHRIALRKLAMMLHVITKSSEKQGRDLYNHSFSVFLYGAETWTLKADNKRRIDAFEMWAWQRMLRIPWIMQWTNISIISETQEPVRSSILSERCSRVFWSCDPEALKKDKEKDLWPCCLTSPKHEWAL